MATTRSSSSRAAAGARNGIWPCPSHAEGARARPPGQRHLEQRRCVFVVAAGQRAPPRVDVGDEQVGIDRDHGAVEHVAVAVAGQRGGPEQAAQPRDVGLHGPDRRLGRPLPPHVVQHLLGRDGFALADQDPRQYAALAGAAEVHRVVTGRRREPAEHAQRARGGRVPVPVPSASRTITPSSTVAPRSAGGSSHGSDRLPRRCIETDLCAVTHVPKPVPEEPRCR